MSRRAVCRFKFSSRVDKYLGTIPIKKLIALIYTLRLPEIWMLISKKRSMRRTWSGWEDPVHALLEDDGVMDFPLLQRAQARGPS